MMRDEPPVTSEEETLIRNWRVLCERERMAFYRAFERLALQERDPGPIPADHLRPATARFRRELRAMMRGSRTKR